MISSKPHTKSIYARGADDGLWAGLLLLCMFGCAAGSLTLPWLNIVVLTVALYIPFFTYRCLRRTHIDCHGITTVSALWMQGIVMFACASIILGLGAYLYMRVFDPGFTLRLFTRGAEFCSAQGTPQGDQLATELRNVVDLGMLPRTADMVLSWMWSVLFFGSLLSLVVTLLARVRRVPVNSDNN